MKKAFILGSAFLLLAGLFMMACKNIDTGNEKGEEMLPYDAKGIGDPLSYREDFLEANKTQGVPYLNENGDVDQGKTSPKFRTFIITEKTQLDEIFSVYPDIDFEKEMVVMYAYTSVYGNRYHIVKSITLDNKNLKIEFKISEGKPGYADAIPPFTQFLVIKMDKLDIDTVEFTLLR